MRIYRNSKRGIFAILHVKYTVSMYGKGTVIHNVELVPEKALNEIEKVKFLINGLN